MKKHGISQQIGKRKDDEAALQRRNIAAAHSFVEVADMTKAKEMLDLAEALQASGTFPSDDVPPMELITRLLDPNERDLAVAALRLAAQADEPGAEVDPITSQSVMTPMKWFRPDDVPQSSSSQREALRQIADLAPEERTIPLDRAFAILREMASIARNELAVRCPAGEPK
jgi:hypothetical protein